MHDAFNVVVTAICSLTQCFPNLTMDLSLEQGYLLTLPLQLGSSQRVRVSLDLASPHFWVFSARQSAQKLQKDIGSGVFDMKTERLVVYRKTSENYTFSYLKPYYDDDFNITFQYARTIINLDGNNMGIPNIGLAMGNVSKYISSLVGGSGVFGVQPESYANGVQISRKPTSVLTLFTPTYGKTKGRIVTGPSNIIKECDTDGFVKFDLVVEDSASSVQYFSFNSELNNKLMVLSSMTSNIAVDPKTFSIIEAALRPVWDTRKGTSSAGIPIRKHKLVPCGLVKKAPVLKIGGPKATLKLAGKDYIKRTKSGYCILKVKQIPENTGRWILGYPFLQKFCLRLDFNKRTVSFADSGQTAGLADDYDDDSSVSDESSEENDGKASSRRSSTKQTTNPPRPSTRSGRSSTAKSSSHVDDSSTVDDADYPDVTEMPD